MRATAFIVSAAALLAVPAGAQKAGASVTVRITPQGGTALFNSPTEAQAACTGAGGYFGLEERQFVCVNPRGPIRSTRTSPAPPSAPRDPPPADPAARGSEVESVTLRPGEHASFTLAEGFSHQLLRRAEPSAPGAITVAYEVTGDTSRVTATSRTGRMLTFRILADPDGNGGFSPVGEMSMTGDGTAAVRSWPGSLGAISVGNFAGPD